MQLLFSLFRDRVENIQVIYSNNGEITAIVELDKTTKTVRNFTTHRKMV